MQALMEYGLTVLLLFALAVPLGWYADRAMRGKRTFLSRLLRPVERCFYRLTGIDAREEMGWKRYAACALWFSVLSLAGLTALLMCQGFLPWNPEGLPGCSWHLAFNTAASFVTNTNWQSYSGESTLSYLSQALGLTVQNFVTPAVALAVLYALIRGFMRARGKSVGNFWRDLTRGLLYVMLPLSVIVTLLLVSQGVPQTLGAYEESALVETVKADDGTAVTQGVVPLGPQASQVAIKQLGTNGGGFNGTNSASPLENPTPFSNLVEVLSILVIPVALCFSFGRAVRDRRQGIAVFMTMAVMFLVAMGICAWAEHAGTPQLAQGGDVAMAQAGGNLEGKETRFGVPGSVTWAVITTAASNGSVNSMHDSYTPLGGLVPTLLMQLGEVVYGGVGCGLYGMIGFIIMTVFVAGLMVGRTPEYLGKKIEPFEMRMAVLVCLGTPIGILVGTAAAALDPTTFASLNNPGPHGFSELLYAFSSAGGNNGSAFAGLNANTPFLNTALGLVMLFGRFLPLFATLAIAGSLVAKKRMSVSVGTLPTHTPLFVTLTVVMVLMVGALSFLPALALGPIAEHLMMWVR